MVKEQNQTEEVNGKTERSGEEKVSALTLSLHPGELIFGVFFVFLWNNYMLNLNHTIFFLAAVVVLESLNSALQKQESLTANDKVLWSFFQLIASQSQRIFFFFFSIWLLVTPLFLSVTSANNRDWKQHRWAGAHAAFASRGESAELQEEEDTCGHRKWWRPGHWRYPNHHFTFIHLMLFTLKNPNVKTGLILLLSLNALLKCFFFTSNRHPAGEEDQDPSESWGQEQQLNLTWFDLVLFVFLPLGSSVAIKIRQMLQGHRYVDHVYHVDHVCQGILVLCW